MGQKSAETLVAYGLVPVLAEFLGDAIGDDTLTHYGAPFTIAAGDTGTTVDFRSNETDATVARFGRDNAGTFESLVEIRNKQTLTGFSGEDIGRGCVRLNDVHQDKTLELGFYEYGAGIITDHNIFEIWCGSTFSVRDLNGSAIPTIMCRDQNDSTCIQLRHDGTDGVVATSDGTPGAISIRPEANETWQFDKQTDGGNLVQNGTYGGYLQLQHHYFGIRQHVDESLTATGSSQTDALLLDAGVNIVTTTAAGTGVRLPVIAAGAIGVSITVYNEGVNALAIYPGSGDVIDALGSNNALSLAAAGAVLLTATKATQWRSIVSA